MTTTPNPVTISSLLGDISQYVYNPAAIQTTITAAISKILDGSIDVVDATNPFALALEMSAVNCAAFCVEAAALTRRQYAAAATTFDDLYLNMSDTDYLNMFALPSTTTFTILLQYEQLLNALVADPTTGISEITIPRNTVFTAAEVPFSLQYPINIRQLQHGGLQAVYDATEVSPLQTLDTNVIPLSMVQMNNGLNYVKFDVLAQQFFINSMQQNVNSASGLQTTIPLTDQFYYCRVYNWVGSTSNGAWVELAVTYTEQVYDPTVPTVVVQLTDTQVSVTVPPVYAINQTIRGQLRIDVYETKGPLTMYLGNYGAKDFVAEWLFIDQNDATPQTAAINQINNLLLYSTDVASGGRDALTFEEMRQRVIAHSNGPRDIPISPAQIQAMLTDDGYTIVKDIDTLTNRSYWAVKPLPSPTDLSPTITNNVYTPANANMLSLTLALADANAAYGCTVHDTGVTITSAALFQSVNGIASLMTSAAYTQLLALPLLQQAEAFNQGGYFYTPFYYVLDDSSDVFVVRPYSLDQPLIESRTFVQENATTGYQVSIGTPFTIVKTATGYQISLTTSSNAAYQALPDTEVMCQLSYTTSDGQNTAFMTAPPQVRAGNAGERTFIFNIVTSYDLDTTNAIDFTSFAIDGQSTTARSALLQDVNVYFTTSATMPISYETSTIDSAIGLFQLPNGSVGLTSEQLSVKFGDYLTNLWCSWRSFTGTIPFQTYPTDVPAYYTTDVYQQDATTGAEFSVVNNAVVFTKLHSKGDPILDSTGAPTYLHRAGDYLLDVETNLPVAQVNYTTQLKRAIDIFALSAVYRFANDTITTAYMTAVSTSLLSWLTEDLVALNETVLEQTRIYFYPSVSQGTVNVSIENGVTVAISAAQSLDVTLYIPTETNNNANLLASLISSTIMTIGDYLATHSTVSVSELLGALRAVYGTDVVDVKLSGFGGDSNYTVLTIENSSTLLSINKVLQVNNNQLAVQEDVSVTFVVHDTN